MMARFAHIPWGWILVVTIPVQVALGATLNGLSFSAGFAGSETLASWVRLASMVNGGIQGVSLLCWVAALLLRWRERRTVQPGA